MRLILVLSVFFITHQSKAEGVSIPSEKDSEGVETPSEEDSEGVETPSEKDSEGVETPSEKDSEGVETPSEKDSEGVETRFKRELKHNTFYEGDIALDNQRGQSHDSEVTGFCLTSSGHDQNSGTGSLKPGSKFECYRQCRAILEATGCEWRKDGKCSYHTRDVAKGNKNEYYTCWILNRSPKGPSIQNAWLSPEQKLWPGGIIYYQIDTSSIQNVDVHQNISIALKHISDCSCLVFNQIPSSQVAAGDFVQFRAHGDETHDGSGCWSYLGRQGGAQVINIGSPECASVPIITHEVLHATGALHEHNRPDRDQYIEILYDNINPDMIQNFAKNDWIYDNATHGVDDFGTGYDFYSLLHYPYNAYGMNSSLPTILSLMTNDTEFGPTGAMTATDQVELNLNYGCPIHSHLLVRYLHDVLEKKSMNNNIFKTFKAHNDEIAKIAKQQENSLLLIGEIKEKQGQHETLTDYSIESLIEDVQSLEEKSQIKNIHKATLLTLTKDFKSLNDRLEKQEVDIQKRDTKINELESKLNAMKEEPLDTFGPLAIENMDTNRTEMAFVTVGQLEMMKKCRFNFQILTDVRFSMRRDDSESQSFIKYWRPDTNVVQTFSFVGGYADHTRVEFDGQVLTCFGPPGKKNYQCQSLVEGVATKAVILSIDFNPRQGKAHNNQWFRNKYSLSGSFYNVKCLGYVSPTRVQFSVQHHGHYDIVAGSTITFDGTVVNVGSAMDVDTGVFTAHVPGTYEFTFAGLSDNRYNLRVHVFVNGENYVQIFAHAGSHEHVSRTWLLQVAQGDTTHLVLTEGSLYGDVGTDHNFAEFTGKLIK